MATVIIRGDATPTARRLLGLAAVVLATQGVRTVDEFALSLRDIPTVEIWPNDPPTQRSYGPVRKGKGGKVRRW